MKLWLQMWRRQPRGIQIIGLLGLLFIIVQLFYPPDRLPPFTRIDSNNLGGWTKTAAAHQLTQQAQQQRVPVYVGKEATQRTTAQPAKLGTTISYETSLNARQYPWWSRLIPTSLLWQHWLEPTVQPSYHHDRAKAKTYLRTKLGFDKACKVAATNASLRYDDKQLVVINARIGGRCTFHQALTAAAVRPTADVAGSVRIPVEPIAPAISNQTAEALKQRIMARSQGGLALKVLSSKKTIPQVTLLSWLEFSAKQRLKVQVDEKKSASYLQRSVAPVVAVTPGTTRISTRDFTVLSRSNGKTGRGLDQQATRQSIANALVDPSTSAIAKTKTVQPTIDYTRRYTKTSVGIAAQLKHYDDENPGTFGASFYELSGRGRSAAHNGQKAFVTASTYKLFVAYGVLRNVESKAWQWDDEISNGRSLSKCFDDMIVLSDNACAEALLKKYGYNRLTKAVRGLGLTDTGFYSAGPVSTADDLALLLRKLQTGELPIKTDSKNRLLAAMKRNVYRQGIPAGSSGTVADKVGFLNGLLHDAAIVSSPKGTYVLVIMTKGSSWASIAELTRKVEALR